MEIAIAMTVSMWRCLAFFLGRFSWDDVPSFRIWGQTGRNL